MSVFLLKCHLTTREDEANNIYYGNRGLFAVDESVQREALKKFYEQRSAQVEKKKLKNALWISYWGVPILVIIFVVTYWIIGMKNYHYNHHGKMEVAQMAEDGEQGSSLGMILGVIGALVALFLALLWWFHPLISSRLQRKKTKGRKDEKDTWAQRKNKICQSSKESKASTIFDIAWQVSGKQMSM